PSGTPGPEQDNDDSAAQEQAATPAADRQQRSPAPKTADRQQPPAADTPQRQGDTPDSQTGSKPGSGSGSGTGSGSGSGSGHSGEPAPPPRTGPPAGSDDTGLPFSFPRGDGPYVQHPNQCPNGRYCDSVYAS
ncbi:hypothetical protein ACSNOD_10680, partial [Streptomyces sp. URMC 123]